jgi:hypothetical protein
MPIAYFEQEDTMSVASGPFHVSYMLDPRKDAAMSISNQVIKTKIRQSQVTFNAGVE